MDKYELKFFPFNFEKKITIISFDSKANGFDLAHLIQEQKVQ